MTDGELIIEMKKGSIQGYETLIDRYTNYIVAVITRVGTQQLREEDIEELASDVFIKLWEIRESLTIQENKEKAYIGTIARHMTLNFLKKKGMTEVLPLEEDLIGDENTPEKIFMKEEERQVIEAVIRSLPQPEQEIFIRRYFYFEKVVDIGKYLGLNDQTVATKLHRGRAKLQKLFRERGLEG